MIAFKELWNTLWSSSDVLWLGASCQCFTIRVWSSWACIRMYYLLFLFMQNH